MDAQQLNKINELAREYLRLGIARNTQDAVEKARFQLSFQAPREKTETPYEALFSGLPKNTEHTPENQNPEDRNEAIFAPPNKTHEQLTSIQRLNEDHQRIIQDHQARIHHLEQSLASLRSEFQTMKRPAPEEPLPLQPITESIEQTIKGRNVTADEVAIDKIFYFGNK